MFHFVQAAGVRCLDWITEFDAFPLFSRIGGMPFPRDDANVRAATIRTTIRRMRSESLGLVMFAEGELHYPPELLPLGRALETVANSVSGCQVVPVAIQYEMAMHERPEAYLLPGSPVPPGDGLLIRTRDALQSLLAECSFKVRQQRAGWEVLVSGTLDVNERWDMRRIRDRRQRQ